MKNYRIKKNSYGEYYIERRFMLFWWYEIREFHELGISKVKLFDSKKEAKEHIKLLKEVDNLDKDISVEYV